MCGVTVVRCTEIAVVQFVAVVLVHPVRVCLLVCHVRHSRVVWVARWVRGSPLKEVIEMSEVVAKSVLLANRSERLGRFRVVRQSIGHFTVEVVGYPLACGTVGDWILFGG